MAVLPKLAWHESPNQSRRNPDPHSGKVGAPYLIVWHRPVGNLAPSISWLCNPDSQASAHVITEGNNTGVDVATQLVPWHMKAWTCRTFNTVSYNIEGDDDAWDGDDPDALLSIARVTAFLCHKTGIPAVNSKTPTHQPGIVTHYQLGRAGGGHTDPSEDAAVIRHAVKLTQKELDRGGFRKTWGRGRLLRIPNV